MGVFYEDFTIRLYHDNVLDWLKTLPDKSIQCCITSPPFFGLRDYGLPKQTWPEVVYNPLAGLECFITIPEQNICLGLEDSPDAFIGHLILISREIYRVLRDDGTYWLNLGDSYAESGGYYPDSPSNKAGSLQAKSNGGGSVRNKVGKTLKIKGLKPKDLMMVPARTALALQADGWYLRSDIDWCKKSSVPEPVIDRPASATENIYLLSKSKKYYYDAFAVREKNENVSGWEKQRSKGVDTWEYSYSEERIKETGQGIDITRTIGDGSTHNLRNFWLLGPNSFKGKHYASFPSEIPRRAILAGSSDYGSCSNCNSPYQRIIERKSDKTNTEESVKQRLRSKVSGGKTGVTLGVTNYITRDMVGWEKTCSCETDEITPCIILEPFSGSGTTLMVAKQLGRKAIGCDLSEDYCKLAVERIQSVTTPMPIFSIKPNEIEQGSFNI